MSELAPIPTIQIDEVSALAYTCSALLELKEPKNNPERLQNSPPNATTVRIFSRHKSVEITGFYGSDEKLIRLIVTDIADNYTTGIIVDFKGGKPTQIHPPVDEKGQIINTLRNRITLALDSQRLPRRSMRAGLPGGRPLSPRI